MSFAENLAQCLSDTGIPIDADSIPDEEVVAQGLEQLATWFASLDQETREAFDEVTGDFPVSVAIADPEADVAVGLESILRAVDQLEASVPVSRLLTAIGDCLQQVRS